MARRFRAWSIAANRGEMQPAALITPESDRSPVRNALGVAVALLLGAGFAAIQLDKLMLNLQYDGMLPEYLAWTQAPQNWGQSLNAQLNPFLYSIYYNLLAAPLRWVDREAVLKVSFVIEILALCGAIFHFVRTVTGSVAAGWLAVVVEVWQRGTALAPGGSSPVGVVAGPEYPATALAFLALAASWQGRHGMAAVLAGIAFNFHGSIAAFAGAMVMAAACVEAGRGSRNVVAAFGRAAARFVVAASPILIWLTLKPAPAATMSVDAWLRFPRWIYPDHMIPSSTPTQQWLLMAAFLAPGCIGLVSLTSRWRNHRAVLTGWIAATALLLVAGVVFVEWLPIRTVAQLTLFRGARFLMLLVLGFGLTYLLEETRRPGFAGFAAALTLLLYVTPVTPELAWVGHLGLAGLFAVIAVRVTGWKRIASGVGVGAALGLLVSDTLRFDRLGEYVSWRWPLAAVGLAFVFFTIGRTTRPVFHLATLAALACVSLWLAEIRVSEPVSQAALHRAAAMRELAPIIEKACPAGGLVVAPPDVRNPGAWASRGSFLCRQQLTTYAYAPWLAEEILKRMQWYLDAPVERVAENEAVVHAMSAGYRRRESQQFEQLRDNYGVRVAIVERDQRLPFPRVGGNAIFDVYALGEPRITQVEPATAQSFASIEPAAHTLTSRTIAPETREPSGPSNQQIITRGRARIVRPVLRAAGSPTP